ncbi:MAG: thioredoxin [Desulfovibrionales bacterium]|nr:MAG: thioredoxin [Desulfovibrionales bacterium]
MTKPRHPRPGSTLGGKRLIGLVLVLLLVAMVYFGSDDVRRGPVGGLPADLVGRVTVLQLTAEHCPSCRDMEPVVHALREQYEGRVHFRDIDVFQRAGTATVYGIQTIPAFVFYDRQGQERHRHEGILDQAVMVKWLEELLAESIGSEAG